MTETILLIKEIYRGNIEYVFFLFTYVLFFLTGQKDTFCLYGITEDLIFNFSSHNYKTDENYGNRKDIKAKLRSQAFFIKSPFKKNLYLSVNFSATYGFSPNIKIIFTGYDHRSWIDIFIAHQEIFKDISSFDMKYLHKTIHLSNSLEANSIMNYKPNSSDQLLVFIPDYSNYSNRHVWKTLDMTITGNSYKILRSQFNYIFKQILQWSAQLKIVSGLQFLLSLQGESYQLKTYIAPKCETKEPCAGLKVYWIPDQLNKYRDSAHNKPYSCLHKPQQDRFNGMPIDCLNFSSHSIKEHYYVYIAGQLSGFMFNRESRMSWNYGSSVCQDMGGFLPVIRNNSELDEFIALVMLSPYLPSQERIFIGLSSKIKSKV